MKNAVFINCIGISNYAFENLLTVPHEFRCGKASFEAVLEYAFKLPQSEEVFILCTAQDKEKVAKFLSSLPKNGKIAFVEKEEWDSSELFEAFSKIDSSDFTNIFYIYGDTPFLDIKAACKMYENHISYNAQYSFSDGGPYGLMPEIIACEISSALKALSDKEKLSIDRETVFTIIQRDINSFDIETDLTEKDLRMLRISFTADSKRNFIMLCDFDKNRVREAKRIINLTAEDQKMLRTLPVYYQIQITDKSFQNCIYLPKTKITPAHVSGSNFMHIEKYREILKKIKEFSEDAVISFSLWGEAAAHPNIEEFIFETLEYENFSLLIETSGIGWKDNTIESIERKLSMSLDKKNRLMWIVFLDSNIPEVYNTIRGEGFQEAFKTEALLAEKFPETTWAQAVRMNENEDTLEQFYKAWKNAGKKIIIQKYDNFCGALPERKVVDISPLKRNACWHLKRDLSIYLDGTVPLCREDVECTQVLGNIFNNSLDEIWKKGECFYLEQLEEKYYNICGKCDEYYTYNF